MTTAQKVIKYIATAFAVFLIITIISAILSGGYALLNAFGLIHTNNNIVTEDLKVISNEVKEISNLQVYTIKSKKMIDFDIDEEYIEELKLELERVATDIHEGKFISCSCDDCKYCQYKNICKSYKKN